MQGHGPLSWPAVIHWQCVDVVLSPGGWQVPLLLLLLPLHGTVIGAAAISGEAAIRQRSVVVALLATVIQDIDGIRVGLHVDLGVVAIAAGDAVLRQSEQGAAVRVGATEQAPVPVSIGGGFLLLGFPQTSLFLGALGFGLLLERFK